ncbi:MAG: rhomboid family intramembrane serine protease [Bacteroidetes bacterium]|nr:rhomboid family intramembrane serine protease [Bacteroidota bacterium]
MQQGPNQKPILGADNNALVALLAINLVAYVMLGFLKVIYFLDGTPIELFYKNIFHLFTLPTSGAAWLTHAWSLFTFYWIHDGFWELFTNMIWLSVFGYVLQMNQSNKHLFPIYFYAGLLGGIAYIMMSFGVGSNFISFPLMGASMSVSALAIAATLLVPRFKLLANIGNGVPVWILSIIYFALQIATLTNYQFANSLVAIISVLTGVVYVLLLKNGVDLGKWMHNLLHWLNKSAAPKTNG